MHTFEIGAEEFLLDGRPFVIRCGEIHFPRVPRAYWTHRLRMCRALGLNTVCVYLFWNFHEWEEGTFDWSGPADAAEFCRLAQAEGLWVLLRPGPYSCAEWEMGGLPWWLVRREGLRVRSADPAFLAPATRYLREVGRVLAPLQITRGGPLLMVQVENEYGSFGDDAAYLGALRQALLEGGFDVPLFACNPPGVLANGHRDDLFQVVNFGPGACEEAFRALRRHQKTGPLMNGEYYPAWFDMWGRRHRTGPLAPILADLEYMLTRRHSFSIYMAHGGTSFGLWAGADRPFSPDTSSYDYDAPISEAGWATPKFTAIRELFARHLPPGETLPPVPAANPVVTVAPFTLTERAALFENLPIPSKTAADAPAPMEFHGQSRGCTLYRSCLPAGPAGTLTARAAHDFAWVFIDGKLAGTMDRRRRRFDVPLGEREGETRLDILVEAMGRVNFGPEVFDRKGLFAPVGLTANDGTRQEVRSWEVFALELDAAQLAGLRYAPCAEGDNAPAFWRGSFALAAAGDTFLDVRSWGKGVAWVNGHCLGRFWNIGPTQTMYVPGPFTRAGRNEVVMLDLLAPRAPLLAGMAEPILDELHPELDFSRKAWAGGTFDPGATAPVCTGTFSANLCWQEARFERPARGRYLCLEAVGSVDECPGAAVSGLEARDATGEILSKAAWKIFWASSEETNYLRGDAENILDGQPATYWHTDSAGATPLPFPHQIVVDLGEAYTLGGIRYLPRPGGPQESGRIKEYRIYLDERAFGLSATA